MIQNEPDLAIVVDRILEELNNAEKLHPKWPKDPIHAAAIVGEESGELTRACLRWVYEMGEHEDMETEAIHTAATAIRFLLNIEEYKREIEAIPPFISYP